MLIVVVMVNSNDGNLSLSPPNCRDQCAFELVAYPAQISMKKLSFNIFMVFLLWLLPLAVEVVEGGSSLSLTGLEADKKVVPAWVQKQVGDLCTLKINCAKHSK